MLELENEYRKRLNSFNKDFYDPKYDRVFGTVNSDNGQDSEYDNLHNVTEGDQQREYTSSPYFNNHNLKQNCSPLRVKHKDIGPYNL